MKSQPAAGPWKRTKPPRDGRWILAVINGTPRAVRFAPTPYYPVKWEAEAVIFTTGDPKLWAEIIPYGQVWRKD